MACLDKNALILAAVTIEFAVSGRRSLRQLQNQMTRTILCSDIQPGQLCVSPRRIASAGSRVASCCVRAPIPRSGRQFAPCNTAFGGTHNSGKATQSIADACGGNVPDLLQGVGCHCRLYCIAFPVETRVSSYRGQHAHDEAGEAGAGAEAAVKEDATQEGAEEAVDDGCREAFSLCSARQLWR